MTTTTERGTYVERDGRPAVRFERVYKHPVERVWRAITDPEELVHWFPSSVAYDARAGGAMEFTEDPYQPTTKGTVLVWDPPHRFGFEWGDDEIHLTLEQASGGCRLELVNFLVARDTAARNATGWDVCLGELDKLVAGRPGSGPHGDDVPDFWPLYDEYVAAGLPSVAEIPMERP